MKLYAHPISTTCRPVLHFIADNNIDVTVESVDLFKGEHHGESYTKLNPNRLIPLLEDGDFHLTESATILRYLAQKIGSRTYPTELRARCAVDERLDWFNSNFYRDWGYGLIYPQAFAHHKREHEAAQASVVALALQKSKNWLQVLNDHWIGPKQQYLCGDQLTIADYFGAGITTVGELIHCDFSAYPNVARWLGAMKQRPSYAKVYAAFNGFVQSTKGKEFHAI
jgi:glutathione S-transferase